MEPTQMKIGHILTGDEQRDAIHIAVLSVIAGEELHPGEPIKLAYGATNIAVRALDEYGTPTSLGIADPFLRRNPEFWEIKKGQHFWMFLYPNTISGLRHHWHHPGVDNVPVIPNESERWLRGFAERWNFDYNEMIEVATNPTKGQDWITAMGRDLHSREELGEDHALFWQHLALLTGKSYSAKHQAKVSALAWLRGDVSHLQVRAALSVGRKREINAYPTLSRALRRAYQQGRLREVQSRKRT